MKMIKNNIAFCIIRILIILVGLLNFSTGIKNIILLQKKEFSLIILTKLIPKGFTSNYRIGLYCFLYYVGLLSYIIDNIAKNIYNIITAEPNYLLLYSVNFIGEAYNNAEIKANNKVVLNKGRVFLGRKEVSSSTGEYITVNNNESEIELLKDFREKEMLSSPSF